MRNIWIFIFVLFLMALVVPASSYAASSVTAEWIPANASSSDYHAISEVVLTVTASSDGSVTDYLIPRQPGLSDSAIVCPFQAVVMPGSTVPQPSYDVELLYDGTIDAANGQLHDLSATANSFADFTSKHCTEKNFTLHLTNNNVPGAVTKIKVKFGR